MNTDTDLRQDIIDELVWEPSIDAAAIGVAVEDGVVTLSGHAPSFAEKWAAEHVAKAVVGAMTGEARRVGGRLYSPHRSAAQRHCSAGGLVE